jgi:cholesterol transport system auxiliary component
MLVSSSSVGRGSRHAFGDLWHSGRSRWPPAAFCGPLAFFCWLFFCLLVSFCLLFLAGCTSEPAPTTFDLDPSVPFAHVKASHSQLAVFEPSAPPPFESRRIVVRTGAGTIAYLHGGQWVADLPTLVQDRLIDGFETAHVLRGVGRPGLVADRSLHTDIQHFEVDIDRKQATVEIYARLVGGNDRVITDRTFSATAAAPDDRVPTIAAALSEAFAKVIHDIVIWTAQRV